MIKIITAALLYCGAVYSVDVDLVRLIYKKDWKEAELKVVDMMTGTYSERLEGAIAGAYIAQQTKDFPEQERYEWMIHRLLAPVLYGNFADTMQKDD